MTPAPGNGRFYARDTTAMAEALKVSGTVRPEAVFAITATNPELPQLRPSAPPAAFSNNHFGYALTWFGLAIALAADAGKAARNFRGLKLRRAKTSAGYRSQQPTCW